MKIVPFKAVCPANDKVGLVTCKVYENYSPAELAAWLEFNPFSFLHVIYPAYLNAQKIGNEKRFKTVKHKYIDFKEENILIGEEKDVFFIYDMQTKEHNFTGIIAGASVEDYISNRIKKHEDTLQYRVELFTEYLHQTGFNTEPVLLTYPDCNELNSWIGLRKMSEPIFKFSTTDKTTHTLWKIDTSVEIEWLQNHFDKIPNLYIADGHHRSASAALLFEKYKNLNEENLKYFMSFLISESSIKIYEFHRLITDLNGFSENQFFEELSKNFMIKPKGYELFKPYKKGIFGMYINQKFYELEFINTRNTTDNLLNNLDAQMLYDFVLQPILGINDLRNDDRIEYISGKQPLTNLMEQVDNENFKVAFLLFPSTINEIKEIADAQFIMPPKSTYIEPKFRSGLVIYEL